ncbi:MAG TPA: hypothetical protein VGP73_08155 [Thermoanaerobaculia bacterium]
MSWKEKPGPRGGPDPKDRAGLAKIHEGVISAGMLALTALGYALSRRGQE